MTADPDYELFAQVAELGSVSGAGRALGLSPAMASKRLSRLEARLGVQLVHRTTRRLALTPAGQGFRDDVRTILLAIKEAESRASGRGQDAAGTLRVSAPTSFGRMHIAPYVKTFLSTHPRVELELNLSDEFVDLFADQADLVVRITSDPPTNVGCSRLGRSRRILCASPAYLREHGEPASLRDLPAHKVLAAKGQSPWRLTGLEGPISVDLPSLVKTNSSEVVRELAIAGVGIALRSLWDVSADLVAGRLVRILDSYEGSADVGIFAIHPAMAFVPHPVSAFIAFLDGVYRPVAPWDAQAENTWLRKPA